MAPFTTPSKKRSKPDEGVSDDGSWSEEESPSKKPRSARTRTRKEKVSDEDKDFETPRKSSSPSKSSPSKSTSSKSSPSKVALKKAETAQKKEWKYDWDVYVNKRQWVKSESYRQKIGYDIYKSDAMKYFKLTKDEMGTMPYAEFPNGHHPNAPPTRSYALANVERLAYRKLSTLAGFHKQEIPEQEFLNTGMNIFSKNQKKRCERYPNTPSKPESFQVFEPYERRNTLSSLPAGSWEEPAYKNGKLVGHWLQFQFDPEADDDDYPKARFKPLGSNKWVVDDGC